MTPETAERNQEMLELRRVGLTLQEIGDHYGVTAERVRQIVRRLERGAPVPGASATPPPRRRRVNGRATQAGGERVQLRIGNMAKAVLVTGQAYQDPKDALNEFVSNAADEYAESGQRGERIRVVLRRKGKRPVIVIDDVGRGLSPDRLREVARNLFESAKAGDDRTLGEKAIGLLAFQQLGGICDVVSRSVDSEETWSLRLERGRADAILTRERRRARQLPGTTAFLTELDPEVLRGLTQRKVVDYLRQRRGAALARGDYTIEVVEGRTAELVTPEEIEGVRLALPVQHTLWGRIEFALYVASDADRRRRVAIVGRAGTTIIDDLADLDEFDREPWTSGQVAGQIVFEALQQTAGRRAVVRDRDAFPVFRAAVLGVERVVVQTLERVRRALDDETADRLSDAVRRIFGRVLKELADLENPMRTLVGTEPGAGGLLEPWPAIPDNRENGDHTNPPPSADPTLDELAPPPVELAGPSETPDPPPDGRPDRNRSKHLPSLAPDPEPGHARSRFDPDPGVVFYNDRHADYLMVKDDESGLLDYLATLVAKEYVVYNNPRATSDDLAEEMVRMLVRVRRHLPRRR
ncbi:MAG: sigma factor-like helix-turn-helix DNA-binding protein [Acidimicrobiales bacterium]